MYCTNCGKQIPQEFKFCKHCGADLSENKNAEAATLPEEEMSSAITQKLSRQPGSFSQAENTTQYGKSEKKPFPTKMILITLCLILLVAVVVLLLQIKSKIDALSDEKPFTITKEDGNEDPEAGLEEVPLYEDLAQKMGIDFLSEQIQYYSADAEHVTVYLSNCRFITSDYVIEMGDGSEFQYPMTYKDIYDAGWRLEYEGDEALLADSVSEEENGWYGFINENGKTVNVQLWNYEDSPVPVDEVRVTQIQAGNIWTEDYSINGISRGATVQEVIAEFGLPYGISYYKWESGEESLCMYYIDQANYISLDFDYDPETGLLDSICYCYIDPAWQGE